MRKEKMQPGRKIQYRLALFTSFLALCVIMLGAYVRLSDAGLGCPDWPGCYGQIDVPTAQDEINAANIAFPQRPVETDKAWKEMVHRYLASSLGLAILVLAILAFKFRKQSGQPLLLPWLLVGLVAFQGALGMWTVTLLVKPAIVTAHLLGGFSTLACLWILFLQLGKNLPPQNTCRQRLRFFTALGILILVFQITLGGWTSTNYAATGCTEFPACYVNNWWPAMDFKEAFIIWRGLGVNYEYGVLNGDARTAIHMTHRIGALITTFYIGILMWLTYKKETHPYIKQLTGIIAALLLLQISLGITNVLAQLPLPVAVAHNGVAALLLLALITLFLAQKDYSQANIYDRQTTR